ncbi:MAG: hypothetical protein IJO69_08650 [Ruminiclostridium sp.]|nr:hypothetical protein [Ruminiclostridium sp.]
MNNRQARKTGRTILVCGFVFVVLNQFLLGALMIGVGLLFSLLLGRCPHCGKTLFTLSDRATNCPKCHGRL